MVGFERAVAEVGGDLAHRCAAFEHVGGVAVAQGVDAELFVVFDRARTRLWRPSWRSRPRLWSWGGCCGQGFAQGDAGTLPAATGAGEEPVGVAMRLPEAAQAMASSPG